MDKDIVEAMLKTSGASASKLGLRFDRVAVRVLGDLSAFAEARAPTGVTVLVTISAPIRLPARTVHELKRDIGARLESPLPRGDQSFTLHGNSVRIRLLEHPRGGTSKFIGFVHNLDAAPEPLLDLAEHWTRDQG